MIFVTKPPQMNANGDSSSRGSVTTPRRRSTRGGTCSASTSVPQLPSLIKNNRAPRPGGANPQDHLNCVTSVSFCIDDDNDDPCSACRDEDENSEEEACDPPCCYTLLWCGILLLIALIAAAGIGLWGSSRFSPKHSDVNFALSSMGATISTTCEGMTCSPSTQKVDDPYVIISGQPIIPGSAFCYKGEGDLYITLSIPAYVTGLTYEHVSKEAHPEKHIKSAPKLFLVNGIRQDSYGQLSDTFLGSLEYLDNGKAKQTFHFKDADLRAKFSQVKISVLGNHGSIFSCIYRVQIHGRLQRQSEEPL